MTDDARPVLNQVNLVVHDMARSAAFYALLGVDLSSPPEPWLAHHREAKFPAGTQLDLDSEQSARLWDNGWPPGRIGPVIGFQVASRAAVDALHDELTNAGHRSQQAPYDAFWGARYAIVEDPDGNPVGIMSPIDPAHATKPPTPPA